MLFFYDFIELTLPHCSSLPRTSIRFLSEMIFLTKARPGNLITRKEGGREEKIITSIINNNMAFAFSRAPVRYQAEKAIVA